MNHLTAPVRLSYRLLDVLSAVFAEQRSIYQGEVSLTSGEDYLRVAERLHRLDRVGQYIVRRVEREWSRRHFCLNCGSEAEQHDCEPDLSRW